MMTYLRPYFASVLLLAGSQIQAAEPAQENRIIETWGYSAKTPATGVERGRQVYEQWCAICHETGPGMAGTQGLQRKYKGAVSPLLREREDLSAEFVEYIVRNGIASMPFFRKTEITDQDLQFLNDYLVKKGD